MPLSPLRQQFAAPGPQIPGQAVVGALGGGLPGAPMAPQPVQPPMQPPMDPRHEALRRMMGMR